MPVTLPRFANLAWRGIKNLPLDTKVGRIGNSIYESAKFLRTNPVTEYSINNPLSAAAIGLGTVAANHALGNPVGGVVDFLTLDTTNFKPEERLGYEETPYSATLIPFPQHITPITNQPSQSPSLSQQSLPSLNEEERRKQLQYLQRKMATDLLTIQALQQGQGGQV